MAKRGELSALLRPEDGIERASSALCWCECTNTPGEKTASKVKEMEPDFKASQQSALSELVELREHIYIRSKKWA